MRGTPSNPPYLNVPRTDRERAKITRGTFVLHLRPIRVSRRAVRWAHTFGLGGSSLVLWLMLVFTGVLMLLVYQPVPGVAYDSVRELASAVRFGALVRGVHYWSANLLIAVVLLHVSRVVLTGGYHRPRRLNWIVGTGLLVFILGSAFTGYLLPWDQRAFWAVTIATGMLGYVPWLGEGLQATIRGGPEIAAPTLLNFYTFHTTILPALTGGLMAFHFWRVRKAGGVIEPPVPNAGADTSRNASVMFFPQLLVRELSQALVILALVIVLGGLVGAPIGERANPGMSPNPAKAPWYFMGFQELLIHLHPIFAVLLLPVAAVAGFAALPWIGKDEGPMGRWFLSAPAKRAAVGAAVVAVAICGAGVVVDSMVAPVANAGPGWLLRGVVPVLAFAVMAAGVVGVARRALKLGWNESVQTLVVFLGVSFCTLTIIGVYFRGPGMALTLPWGG